MYIVDYVAYIYLFPHPGWSAKKSACNSWWLLRIRWLLLYRVIEQHGPLKAPETPMRYVSNLDLTERYPRPHLVEVYA